MYNLAFFRILIAKEFDILYEYTFQNTFLEI